MAKERIEMLTNLPDEIVSRLYRKISRHALVLLKNQYLLSLDRANLRECTRYYMKVLGIPCAHIICCHIDTKKHIEVKSFAKQWKLNTVNNLDHEVFEILHPFAFKRRKVAIGAPKNDQASTFGLRTRGEATWCQEV